MRGKTMILAIVFLHAVQGAILLPPPCGITQFQFQFGQLKIFVRHRALTIYFRDNHRVFW
jgi:hypothetical protein